MTPRLLSLVQDAARRAEVAAASAGSGIYSLAQRRDLYARWLRGRALLRSRGESVAPLTPEHERNLIDLLDPRGVR